MLRIGLPKGVVRKRSHEVIHRLFGGHVDELCLCHRNARHAAFLLKHRDIPRLVGSGRLDIGITSSEWVIESGYPLVTVAELDWCDTRISLIGARGAQPPRAGQTCVTEFPLITKALLGRDLPMLALSVVSGSCEALVPAIYDYCVDCVETGSTLEANNLTELACLMKSRVIIVCRDDNRTIIRDLAIGLLHAVEVV